MKKVLRDLGCNDRELSILFTGDDYIADLNRQYRGKEGPTNVLAFSMSEGELTDVKSGMMGDVVISVDTALRESREMGETIEQTVKRLLIHGVLHLAGYDHERSAEDEDIMLKEEERLLSIIQD